MTVTDTQILAAIADLTALKGYPPTFRELGDQVGLRSTSSAFGRCLGLAEAGLLEPFGTAKARGIRLTAAGAERVSPGRPVAPISAAPRVQRVPVLRSSASLVRYLETPAHRERVNPAAALAGQDVQLVPLAAVRSEKRAQRQASPKPASVFDRASVRTERKEGVMPVYEPVAYKGHTYEPVAYKGHTIELSYEKCLGGWTQWFYAVFRDRDGYECTSGFEDSAETYQSQVENFKRRIDNELAEADPWCEKEGLL